VLALGALLAWSALAAAPLETVRECALRVPPAISGIKELEAACPQLTDALQALGLTPMLYQGWQSRLNRDALKDMLALTDRYAGSRAGQAPDIAALPAILQALAREQTPVTQSWWDAVRAWLKSWVAQHPNALSWLDRWLDRLGPSATLFQAIYYSLVALVLIGAAAVIVMEVKAIGAGRQGRNRVSAARRLSAPSADDGWVEPEPDALADRLMALLRKLVNRLIQTRRLAAERSLTHRELVARSAFDDDGQRAVFSELAGTAESTLYGPHAATPEQLDRILSEGRVLLTQLTDLPDAH
jgi:uncharacterized protein DUF4129